MTTLPLDGSRNRSRPRWLVRLAGVGVTLIVLVACAPGIVAWSGLLPSVVRSAFGDSVDTFSVGEVSLGWLRPITLRNIHCSKEDHFDATIDSVTSSKSLLTLVLDWQDFGDIAIHQPIIAAKLPDTTEPAPLPDDSAHTPEVAAASLPQLRGAVSITNGKLSIQEGAGAPIAMDGIDLAAQFGTEPGVIRLKGSAKAPETDASLAIAADVILGGQFAVQKANGNLQAKDFPVAALNAALAAAGDPTRLQGKLTSDLRFDYNATNLSLELEGTGRLEQLVVQAAALQPDELAVTTLDAAVHASIHPGGIRIDKSEIHSDLGTLHGKGVVSWAEAASDDQLDVEGSIELAAIARQLPHLLAIRQGTNLTGGRVLMNVRHRPASSESWTTKIEVADLQATRGGETLAWPQPLVMAAAIHRNPSGQHYLQSLQVNSDFLTVQGGGNAASFEVAATSDLDRLQQRLEQFIDLQGTRLAGRLTARMQGERAPDELLKVRAAARGEKLGIEQGGQSLIAENLVNAQFQAIASGIAIEDLRSLSIVVQSEQDELTAALRQGEGDADGTTVTTIELRASGNLARFASRASRWTSSLDAYHLAGDGSLRTTLAVQGNQWSYRDLRFDAKNLALTSPGLNITEPSFTIRSAKGSGTTSFDTFRASQMIAEGTGLRAEVPELIYQSTASESLTAKVAFDADLVTIHRWTRPEPNAGQVSGRARGQLNVACVDTRWDSDLAGVLEKVKYISAGDVLLDEPRIELHATVSANDNFERLELRRLQGSAPGIAIDAKGTLSDAFQSQRLDLEGTMAYDLAQSQSRIGRLLGDQIVLAGKETRSFRLTGPLAAPTPAATQFASGQLIEKGTAATFESLAGKFGFGWQAASFYGFRASAADVNISLKNHWLHTQPIQFTLSGGTVHLQPAIHFGEERTLFIHPAGTLANHVDVTREMCDGALQYIAPVLAKSVDLRGQVTLAVSDVRVPIGHMEEADFSGVLRLQYVIASGSPLIQELLILSEGEPMIRLAPDSEVRFRVAKGRVYHENLQIRLPGTTITTSGSVGFDQSLALVVETPIPTKWLRSKQFAEQLKNERVRIPLGGTLDRPRLDQKALEKEVARFIERAAGKRIEAEINKEIDKQINGLFDRLR